MSDSSEPLDGSTDAARRADFARRIRPEIASIHRRLRRLGVRVADLADVAHDVMVKVWDHWDRFDRTKPLAPWLASYCVRLASNYRRRAENRVVSPVAELELHDPAELAEAALSRHEDAGLLFEALDGLSDEQRALVVLVDLEENAVSEVASSLGIPLNTAYTRLRLGRAQLERIVRQRLLVRGDR